MSEETTCCCPRFDPTPWDEKSFEWTGKKFVKDRVFTFFYVPVNFSSVVQRMMAKIGRAGATAPEWMGLSDHTSKWNMDLYVPVEKEVPGLENTELTGQFFSKVYEGQFKDTSKWCEDFDALLKKRNLAAKRCFMWYTTCPRCARKYGKNYVVIIGQTQ